MKAYQTLNQGRTLGKNMSMRLLQGIKLASGMQSSKFLTGDAPNGRTQSGNVNAGGDVMGPPAGP